MSRLFRLTNSLHGRLTMSYTLVTVAALLVAELILLGGMVTVTRSDWLLDQIADGLQQTLAAEAALYLGQEPPDEVGLQEWVARTFDTTLTLETSSALRFSFDQQQEIAIVNADGRLLTQSPPDSRLNAHNPELITLLNRAQMGERAFAQLRQPLPNGQMVMVLPMTAEDGRYLGAFLFTFALPGFNWGTLGPVLQMLLLSLIPFTLIAGLIGTLFGYLTARQLTQRLDTVALAAEAWSKGDFSAVAADSSPDELGQLSRRLNRMAEQLQNLLQTREALAAVEERNKLARDLHDAVKQQLFATTMQVGAAKALLATNPTSAAQHLAEAETLAQQAQQELNTLIQELRPAALHGRGLAAALRQYGADWARQNNIPLAVKVQGEQPLPLANEQALWRVAQEALANVAKHSGATSAELHLEWQPQAIALTVTDNGRGFDPQQPPTGLGLHSMRERMEGVGGRLTITSGANRGTEISAWLTR